MKALLLLACAFSFAGEPTPEDVLRSPTVKATLGPNDTLMPMEVANFLLDRPELTAWYVNKRRVAPYVVEKRGPGLWHADDGAHTSGLVKLLERGDAKRSYFADGEHTGAPFGKIRALGVLTMTMKPWKREGCPTGISSSLDVAVKVKNPVVAGLAKTMRRFIRKTVARKFSRAFLTAHKVGVLLAEDPQGVTEELASFPGLSKEDAVALRKLTKGLVRPSESCLPK